MAKPWPEEQIMYLGFLIESGMTNVEIAAEFGKSQSLIRLAARRHFGGNPNYRRMKTKHAHLREPVFRYFLNHTFEETMKHFKLTKSELRAIFTVGYRRPELKHLRKDTRRKDAWTVDDLVYMLQRVGLIRREQIGKHLKRGDNVRIVKEKLQKLGVNGKTLQGMTLSTYRLSFGKEPSFTIKTKAGPCGGKKGKITLNGQFKIIPWVILRDEVDLGIIEVPELVEVYIKTMAKFQEWIFGGNVLKKMHKIVKENK